MNRNCTMEPSITCVDIAFHTLLNPLSKIMRKIVMSRLEKDDYFLQVANLIKERATCARRKVGCVLVDEHFHIIATGYNGNAKGMPHCIDIPCPGANLPSGQGLDLCEAIHAEQNALLQCPDVMKIHRAYTTTLPCVHCMKLLLNTSVKSIYYIEPYVNDSVFELAARRNIELVQKTPSFQHA